MSFHALVWAMNCDIKPATVKFVLVALANFAGDTGQTWPSNETITRLTGLHEDTVRSALASLVTDGVIHDTGKRVGTTGRVRVYQLPFEACPNTPKKQGIKLVNTPKKRDIVETQQNQANGAEIPEQTPNNPPVFRGHNREPGTSTTITAVEIPPSLNTEDFCKWWADWLADRRDRKKPVTDRAARLQLGKMEKWGVERAVDAIKTAIENGWQGIFEPRQNYGNKTSGRGGNTVDRNAGTANEGRAAGYAKVGCRT